MRAFVLIYFGIAVVFSFTAVFVPYAPGPQIIDWFVDDSGRYEVFAPVGVLIIFSMIPLLVIVFLVNVIRPLLKSSPEVLLDQSSLVIHREKAFYASVHSMSILVNGNKVGTVMSGKTVQIPLSQGEHKIQVDANGQATYVMTIQIAENTPNRYVAGFKLISGKQQIFLIPDQAFSLEKL